MEESYSLAYLTTAPMDPPETVRLAAKLGFASIGVRVAAVSPGGVYSPLGENAAMLRETLECAKGTGVGIYDVEIARVGAGFKFSEFSRSFEVAGELGAKVVTVVSDDPEESRFVQSFADCCDAAATYGMVAALEFMPYSTVPSAMDAFRIVRAVKRANARILADALHVARSKTTLSDLSAIPGEYLSHLQICDAPGEVPATIEGLIHTARCARLLPGEGDIDLLGIIRHLPTHIPIGVEVPNSEQVAHVGVEEWTRRGLAASKKIMSRAYDYRAGAGNDHGKR